MNSSSCFVAQIDLAIAPKLEKELREQGFEFSHPKYTLFQAKKRGISCTLYKSGKLTVQGSEKGEFIAFYLEPNILGSLAYSYPETLLDLTPHAGVDESGKGDLFGPLVIGSLFADQEGITKLSKMGIRDSKKMTDSSILKYAEQIRQHFCFALVTIFPQKYNELYKKFKNLNHLLGWGHATAIEKILQKRVCQRVTIDQFASEHVVKSALERKGIKIELTQRHRGEEDPVVAAASIIARAAFIEGMERLSQEFQIELPKGASDRTVRAGQKFVAKHGGEFLSHVAKMHFTTIKKIL